jgi:hypothetical protein
MKPIGYLIFWLLVLSGCNDDNDAKCLPPAVSLLSFSFAGAIDGTYTVAGEAPSSASMNLYDYSWAMGGKFSEYGVNWINIHSNLMYQSQYSSRASLIVQMHVPDKGVGKYPLPNRGLDFLTLEYSPNMHGELLFEFVSGTVDVTYYQCDRIIGTFSGELQGYNDGELVVINVTNGEFDVKVRRI